MTPISCAAFAALKVITASLAISGACPSYMTVQEATPGVVLGFSQAQASRLDVSASDITILSFRSKDTQYAALNCRNASNVTIIDAEIVSPGTAGMTATECDHVTVINSTVTGSKGDGFDFAGSSYVTVIGGGCSANVPTPIHPDCVQGWSYNGKPASHFHVVGMTINGATQGIDNFGPNTGEADWDVIGNSLSTSHANGIAIIGVPAVVVVGNTLVSTPGSTTGPTAIRILCGVDRKPCADAVIVGNSAGITADISNNVAISAPSAVSPP